MKRILIIFSLLLGIFCSVSNVSYAANNLSAFGVVFENSDEIPAFKSVAIKNLTKSETFVHDRHKFLGVRKLIDILGEVKSEDRRVRFTTNYMRISDDETVSLVDKATWYYFLSKKYKDIFKSLRFKDIKFNKLTLKEFNILFPYELEKNLINYLNIVANKDYIKLGVSKDNASFLYKELDLSKSKDVIILINNEIKTIKKFIKEK